MPKANGQISRAHSWECATFSPLPCLSPSLEILALATAQVVLAKTIMAARRILKALDSKVCFV